MKLLEHRGKELLSKSGIHVPPSLVITNKDYVNIGYHRRAYHQFFSTFQNVIIKAQVIRGGRAKAGLVVQSDNYKDSLSVISSLYEKTYNDVPVDTLLVEQTLDIKKEYFLSILWDTGNRSPMIVLSASGGIDVEDAESEPETLSVSVRDGVSPYQARELSRRAGATGKTVMKIADVVLKAFNCFLAYDCRILEINPLIETTDGRIVAGDAKITIDDSGVGRQDIFHDVTEIEDKTLLTPRAIQARKIDYHDHRGVAGKTFVEFDGDIGFMASGGGVSIVCMDAIAHAGGTPANYVEYSGNPPREKVRKLTKITLEDNEKLNGLLIAGSTANFTDIYETLAGFLEGLEDLEELPRYPIMIRRSGPRADEAFDMIRDWQSTHDIDLTLYGDEKPLTEAVVELVKKAQEYKHDNSRN